MTQNFERGAPRLLLPGSLSTYSSPQLFCCMANAGFKGSESDSDIDGLDPDELLKKLSDSKRKRKRVDDERPGERYASLTSDGSSPSQSDEDIHDPAGPEIGLEDSDASEDEASDIEKGGRSVGRMTSQGARSNGHAERQSRIKSFDSLSHNNVKRDFADLGASKVLVSALTTMSIRHPTEVQAACIPPLLAGMNYASANRPVLIDFIIGRDCVGNAKTGSGKTIAFALPILQRLSIDPYGVFALVLTPTRYALNS